MIHHGDCLDVLRGMDDGCVDSVVTDPPYGLAFMGKRWDYDVPSVEIWAECLRVLKPGGHLVAFAGTRTQHRMAVNIEDAGFTIRDMLAWVYAQGFPKSHNLPGGLGTALKPSIEPVTLARKPFKGTVAANVLEHGTGALNVDGCRVATDEENPSIARRKGAVNHLSTRPARETEAEGRMASRQSPEAFRAERAGEHLGRWPANLLHDGSEEVVGLFPAKAGGGTATRGASSRIYGGGKGFTKATGETVGFGDSGSAARFFYCAKASKRDRDSGGVRNIHATVKPHDLMRWLCRLVTPPGGIVLDPFMGSGSTGKAAMAEGFRFIGIEREAEYVEIARRRIEAATDLLAAE